MAIRPVKEVPKRVRGHAHGETFVDADMREFVRVINHDFERAGDAE